MANGKIPAFRYRILHNCFSNRRKRYWTIQELIEKLREYDISVERRSIENDFQTMRTDERLGYFAPIVYDRQQKAFCYSDETFSLDSIPLTTDDLRSLWFATHILQQYKDAAMVKQFEAALDKVVKVVHHLGGGDGVVVGKPVIDFERAPYYKGLGYFDVLLSAILDRRALRITHSKFSSAPDVHVFHAYFLKEYRNRWYVLGYSEARGHVVSLGLDRIDDVADAAVPFVTNDVLAPAEYFEHTLGISMGKGGVEEIDLWFSPLQGNYVKTQHLHHSQQMQSDTTDGLVVRLRLIPNYELKQLVLSFGPEAEVLKPLWLRQEVATLVRDMGSRYLQI